ncbi:hypothetical protein [Saccharibacillus qingshengii]|uniref:hypothetical protein n=1 Tax=Saccharibacillus qingshengii TaxID=1763540 RepID=UPI001555AA51|nr:hypothetical protein [Saccharibacillus qingshengii]
MEYAPLYEALSEVHEMLLDMGVKGRQGVDLFIEALDTQEQAALDKAYDEAFVSFESYEGRMEPILKDVQRMVDAR